ncbi:MAG: hypothetical protein Ct9H300mP7_4260 [Verrucomicrobiota bacterium]|nr:MAG: hypothetical protein Ct9H300mP7_4260 [Verrucomicrobiota bacterium]
MLIYASFEPPLGAVYPNWRRKIPPSQALTKIVSLGRALGRLNGHVPREYTLKSFRAPIELNIDYETELNAQQLAAVSAPPGPALVLAGAARARHDLTYRVPTCSSKASRWTASCC